MVENVKPQHLSARTTPVVYAVKPSFDGRAPDPNWNQITNFWSSVFRLTTTISTTITSTITEKMITTSVTATKTVVVQSCIPTGTAFSALKSQAYAHCLSPISTTTSSTPKPSFTSSLTSSTVIFTCAKLVNVTGLCSRRRGIWAEEPIVVSFDDDVDRAVQILFTPVLRYCSKLLIHY